MRTLVIDCATEMCSVALVEGGTVLAADSAVLGRGHAEHLVPMIAALPERGRGGRIAVAMGPGSFTGVRVGLAAARALALAWTAELVGYPTLALVAAMARDAKGARPIVVAMAGGHGEWFVQEFAGDGAALGQHRSLRPEIAAQLACPVVAGSQAEALIAARGFGEAVPLLPEARHFGLLGATALVSDPHPIYGRGPDARLPA